jgi:ADP-ribosylglycohydrolase
MPASMSTDAHDRALGALYGLAIGDALGMPTQQLARALVVDIFGKLAGFEAGPPQNAISTGMPAGTVTDDTEQAIIVAETLLEGDGRIDYDALATRLRAWERLASARGGEQLGPSSRRALDELANGTPPHEAGRRGDTNGAAMRIAPVGIAFMSKPLAPFVDAVEEACALTHNTGLAISGACAVAAAVSAGVDGAGVHDVFPLAMEAAALGSARGNFSAGASVARRIEFAIDLARRIPDDDEFVESVSELLGTSVATQESVPAAFAFVARWPDDPWQACLAAAGAGGDSDTIGAMAGAVLGSCLGFSCLPRAAVATIDSVNQLDLVGLSRRLLVLRKGGGR